MLELVKGSTRAVSGGRDSAKPFCASPQLISRLENLGTIFDVEPGTMIFAAGDPTAGVYLVLSGRVALWHGPDHLRVTRIATAGSLLGVPATVRNKPYSLSAEAVAETRLALATPEQIASLIANDPAIAMEIIKMLGEEIMTLRERPAYQLETKPRE